jgi:hypothetical protein
MSVRSTWSILLLSLTGLAGTGACGSEPPTRDDGLGPVVGIDAGPGSPGSNDSGSSPLQDAASAARDSAVSATDASSRAPDSSSSGGDANVATLDAAADADATSGAVDASVVPDAGPTVACNPADKKPEPTNMPITSIKRYQGMTVAPAKGPYKPVLESDPGFPDWTVYRPEKLGDIKHPILVWANGGCSKDGTYFSKFLLEVASYGFVAVADGKPNGSGTRPLGSDGAPQISALDWIIKENERPCSQYYHKLDVSKTAAAGQSCGGLMTLGASKDKRLSTVIIFNSGLFERDQAIYSGLHAPMAYFIGGSSDIAFDQAEADVKAISTVPLFYGNLDVGHFATWAQDNAGEFGRVGVSWLKWKLMADPAAEKMFAGPDCELCKPPSMWKVAKKMMD